MTRGGTINLTINSGKDITLAGGSNLDALSSLILAGIGGFNSSAIAIGADSAVVDIQASAAKSTGVTIEIGDYAAGGGAAYFTGSTLVVNDITIGDGRNEIIVTGGIGDDTVTYNTVFAGADEGIIEINLGTTSTGDTLKLADDDLDFTGATISLTGVDKINDGGSSNGLILNASVVSGQEIEFGAFANLTLEGTGSADSIDLRDIDVSSVTTAVVINGNGGNDTIYSADGSDVTVDGGAGNDTIYAGDENTIIGGAGDDVIKLTAGNLKTETIVFSASNGIDTITGFEFGATGDKLKLTDLVGSFTQGATSQSVLVTGDSSSKASVKTADWAASGANENGLGVILVTDDAASDWSDVADVIGAAIDFDTTATNNGTFAIAIDNGATTRLYVYKDVANDFSGTDDLKLVGTVDIDDVNGFDVANFDI